MAGCALCKGAEGQGMSDIFLSYASKDLSRVRPLIDALERHGWSVWWDRTILPGQTYDQVIDEALAAARCVIVVWSSASVGSEWVRAEADEGRQRHILVPVLFDEVRMPLGFRQIQAARLADWQGTEAHQEFAKVVRAVTNILRSPLPEGTVQPGNEATVELQREVSPPGTGTASGLAQPEARDDRVSQEERRQPAWERPQGGITSGKEKVQLSRSQKRLLLVGLLAVLLIAPVLYWTISQKQVAPPRTPPPPGKPELARSVTNRIGMEFVLIPAGEFPMGADNGTDDEKPVHRVRISKPFYLGIYEVTQSQWQTIMNNNPSAFQGDSNLPVENVSWDDVQEFLRKLHAREGRTTYRLPTEAEWEYAARAGTTTAYSFGNEASQLGEYAWCAENSGEKTHPVGQKNPNAWGMYDLHGNVWEWVQDWYGKYTTDTVTDPQGPSSGSLRVFRGGSWRNGARDCRSAHRYYAAPGNRRGTLGFRLLRTAE
jgi:formylglycine-generating enzyme required for sulfatase activity